MNDSFESWVEETVTLDAGYADERLILRLYLPRNAEPPYQVMVYFPDGNPFASRVSSAGFLQEGQEVSFVPRSGRALVIPVFDRSFERFDGFVYPADDVSAQLYEHMIQWREELGRTIDYLESREDVDIEKLGYYSVSFGASMGLPLLAFEERLKVAVLRGAGLPGGRLLPEGDPFNFVPRITLPVLMLNGRFDFVFPYETSQTALFTRLGTPAEHKRRLTYDVGHARLPRAEVIRESSAWLDTYLGPVATR